MRSIRLWRLTWLVVAAAWTPASAQGTSGEWNVDVAPHLMGASMSGATTVRNTNVDFNQGAFAVYGLRRPGEAADATFGVRVNTLQGELAFQSPDVRVDDDKTERAPIGFRF